MAYCGATTASLSQYARHIKPTDATIRLLNEAATALEALKDLVAAHAARSAFAQLFAANEYKFAAMSAERVVERSMRSVMELAIQQNMADAASINGKVDVLLKKGSRPSPPPLPPFELFQWCPFFFPKCRPVRAQNPPAPPPRAHRVAARAALARQRRSDPAAICRRNAQRQPAPDGEGAGRRRDLHGRGAVGIGRSRPCTDSHGRGASGQWGYPCAIRRKGGRIPTRERGRRGGRRVGGSLMRFRIQMETDTPWPTRPAASLSCYMAGAVAV
jgi:hypothetical protein